MTASLLGVGFTTGVASGMLGVGGGFILIPLLSLLGTPLQEAVGASLVYVLFTSVSGAVRHLQQGTADARLAGPLMAASAVTAAAGSIVGVILSEGVLGLAFTTVTVIALALFNAHVTPPPPTRAEEARGRLWIARRRVAGDATYAYAFHVGAAVGTGMLIGLVTGMLGIGGGFLLVPTLVALLRIPLPIAIGSSLTSILAAAAAGVAAHWSLLGIRLATVLPLVAGGIVGAQVGARLVVWLPPSRLRLVYNALLVLATVYMLAHTIAQLSGPAAA